MDGSRRLHTRDSSPGELLGFAWCEKSIAHVRRSLLKGALKILCIYNVGSVVYVMRGMRKRPQKRHLDFIVTRPS